MTAVSGRVLVLMHQNYEPLNVCHVHRAFVLVICGKAEIVEANGHSIWTLHRQLPRAVGNPAAAPDQT